MYCMIRRAVFGPILLLSIGCCMCGCGDQRVTYLPTGFADARPCADSSVSLYQRGQCNRTSLKQEWLESYLLGLVTGPKMTHLFDRGKLRIALPSIQRGLAEWGNVCVGNIFAEGMPIYDATILIRDGHIQGGTYGKYGYNGTIKIKFPVTAIPKDAYETIQ